MTNNDIQTTDPQHSTDNPQAVPKSQLQQNSNPQSVSGQDVLRDSNTRIVVPSGSTPSSTAPTPENSPAGINWLMVVVAAAVIVFAVEFFIRRYLRSQKL